MGKLRHLGLATPPSRSTLSYANTHRPWEVFEDAFYSLLDEARGIAALRKRRFRFKNPLRSIDASTIHLCREVFDWARYGRTKGAIKLHLMLDHHGCLPGWACITGGEVSDVTVAKGLRFRCSATSWPTRSSSWTASEADSNARSHCDVWSSGMPPTSGASRC